MSVDLGREITLTGIPCRLGDSIEILQASSFEKLMQVPAQSTIDLQFLSPTSFKQAKNIQPFPLPDLVFNGLLRRWNIFAPEKTTFASSGVERFGFRLRTENLRHENGRGCRNWGGR